MLYFLFFILGSIIGSFLNMCIYRLPNKISLFFPGSFCPKCKEGIKWYDNIPLLSFLILKGRCRNCKETIPIRYFLVEFLTGSLFLYLFFLYGLEKELLVWLFFFSVLILIAFIDIETFLVLDNVIYPAIIIGFIIIFLWKDYNNIFGFLSGLLIIFLVAKGGKIILKKEGMGDGDIWIAGLIGLFLGFKLLILSLLISSICAIVITIPLILLKKKKRTDYIPYGPYLAFGAFVSFVFKEKIYNILNKILI